MFGRSDKVLDILQNIRIAVGVAANEQKHLEVEQAEQRLEINRMWTQLQDLRIRLELMEPRQQEVAMYSNIPMHVTDDEQDAKWQLENGLIEKKEYEQLLEQLGLEPNVEIEHY